MSASKSVLRKIKYAILYIYFIFRTIEIHFLIVLAQYVCFRLLHSFGSIDRVKEREKNHFAEWNAPRSAPRLPSHNRAKKYCLRKPNNFFSSKITPNTEEKRRVQTNWEKSVRKALQQIKAEKKTVVYERKHWIGVQQKKKEFGRRSEQKEHTHTRPPN